MTWTLERPGYTPVVIAETEGSGTGLRTFPVSLPDGVLEGDVRPETLHIDESCSVVESN